MRYEDSVSDPGRTFAAGGILGGLYVFTTNDRWEEVELDSTAKILHKVGTSKILHKVGTSQILHKEGTTSNPLHKVGTSKFLLYMGTC